MRTGASEATALGNVAVQAVATGHLPNLAAARRVPVRLGWRPAKKDTRKIDLLLGLLLALQAHGDATAAGELAETGEAFAIVL